MKYYIFYIYNSRLCEIICIYQKYTFAASS